MEQMEKGLKNISRLIQIMFIWIFFLLFLKIFEEKLIYSLGSQLFEGDIGKRIVSDSLQISYRFLGFLFLVAGFFVYFNIEKIRQLFKNYQNELDKGDQSLRALREVSKEVEERREKKAQFLSQLESNKQDSEKRSLQKNEVQQLLKEKILEIDKKMQQLNQGIQNSLQKIDPQAFNQHLIENIALKFPFQHFKQQILELQDQIFKMQLLMVDLTLEITPGNEAKRATSDLVKLSEYFTYILQQVTDCSEDIRKNLDQSEKEFTSILKQADLVEPGDVYHLLEDVMQKVAELSLQFDSFTKEKDESSVTQLLSKDGDAEISFLNNVKKMIKDEARPILLAPPLETEKFTVQ